jgi:hypothetical protein
MQFRGPDKKKKPRHAKNRRWQREDHIVCKQITIA